MGAGEKAIVAACRGVRVRAPIFDGAVIAMFVAMLLASAIITVVIARCVIVTCLISVLVAMLLSHCR